MCRGFVDLPDCLNICLVHVQLLDLRRLQMFVLSLDLNGNLGLVNRYKILISYEIESTDRDRRSDVTGKMETFNDLSGLMILTEFFSPSELMISIPGKIS